MYGPFIVLIGFGIFLGLLIGWTVYTTDDMKRIHTEGTTHEVMTVVGKTIIADYRAEHESCVLEDSHGTRWIDDSNGCAYNINDMVTVDKIPQIKFYNYIQYKVDGSIVKISETQ